MCKYCRHLNELKNRDKAYYETLIKSWRKTCARQERLLMQTLLFLEFPYDACLLSVGSSALSDLIDCIKKELGKEVVHD